ncbi:MAG: divalent-cation tolerance protein CutA [Acidimicrobiia bacterium]
MPHRRTVQRPTRPPRRPTHRVAGASQRGRRDPTIVLTTIGSDTKAEDLARALIEERLAACVNISAEMVSIYRWKDRLEQDRERQIVIKTTADRVDALAARIRALHPYELPEFLVISVAGGSKEYLAWVGESVSRSS